MDVLQRCLQRDPRKRPGIPQLLEHGFLSSDTIRLSRGAFDRAMEALVTSFFSAAEAVSTEAGAEEHDDSEEARSGIQDCWQILSDEVWQRMSRTEHGRCQANAQETGFSGIAYFKQWLQRGAKRQRTAAPSEASNWVSACTPAAASSAPAAPAPAPVSAKPAAVVPRPAVLTTGSATGGSTFGGNAAARSGSAGKPQPSAQATRTPLATINSGNSKTTQQPPIYAELLQKQRSCLRKAAPAVGGKENAIPGQCLAKGAASVIGNAAPENLVLRRLKDRRALVADERVEEEQTQLTRWGHV